MAAGVRSRLSADDLDFFHREGYLKFGKPIYSAEKFAALKAHFEEKLANMKSTGFTCTDSGMLACFDSPALI